MAEDINEGVRDFICKTALPDNIKEKGYKQFSKEQAKMEQLSMMTSTKELVQTFSLLYYNYNWFFGTVYGREKLIVSDNPAKWIVLGLNDICFPISERNALILKVKKENSQMFTDDVPVGNIINLSDKSVVSYNMLQYVGANRYLFGDEKTLIRLRELYSKVYPDKKWTLPKMLHSI